jgi:hypothetical protein
MAERASSGGVARVAQRSRNTAALSDASVPPRGGPPAAPKEFISPVDRGSLVAGPHPSKLLVGKPSARLAARGGGRPRRRRHKDDATGTKVK